MKLATNPRRNSRASTRIAPTSGERCGRRDELLRIAVRDHQAELRGCQDRHCGGRADAEYTRRPEQRVDHHRDESGVESHRHGQAGHCRIGHGLRQHDRRRHEAGDRVAPHGRRTRILGRRLEKRPSHPISVLLLVYESPNIALPSTAVTVTFRNTLRTGYSCAVMTFASPVFACLRRSRSDFERRPRSVLCRHTNRPRR